MGGAVIIEWLHVHYHIWYNLHGTITVVDKREN